MWHSHTGADFGMELQQQEVLRLLSFALALLQPLENMRWVWREDSSSREGS